MAESDVAAVKQEIIGLMITAPPGLQVQLGEAISIIAESDFWERWDTLIDVDTPPALYGLVQQLTCRSSGPRLSSHS